MEQKTITVGGIIYEKEELIAMIRETPDIKAILKELGFRFISKSRDSLKSPPINVPLRL